MEWVVVRDRVFGYDTITIKVSVNRAETNWNLLAKNGWDVSQDAKTVTIKGGGEEEVELVFFCTRREMELHEVQESRKLLGLVPDLQAQIQANLDHPSFSDSHWNGDCWPEPARGFWQVIDFSNRKVSTGGGRPAKWKSIAWFAGKRNA